MMIRPATAADFPKIAALQVASWQDAYAEALPEAFLKETLAPTLQAYWETTDLRTDGLIRVAGAEELQGFIAVQQHPTPYIDHLHVHPTFRSQHIGSTLMHAAATDLLAAGFRTAYLWVFHSNQPAIRFYEKLGGQRTDVLTRDLFGFPILSQRIEWADLTQLQALAVPHKEEPLRDIR